MMIKVCNSNVKYGDKGRLVFPKNRGDVGYDLIAQSSPRIVGDCHISHFFKSLKYIEYDTNISIEPSSDKYGDYDFFTLLYPRSSISDYNLSLCNSVGVIDSGYRNTIKVRFNYIPQPENYTILKEKHLLISVDSSSIYQKGDKIAQLVFAKSVYPKINFVDQLEESERNVGGFGSTGK
jgi:dUTPase